MSINQFILRSLKKNLKNYYLYAFALIFSVALYFAFVTLQYDPNMDHLKSTIKGAAGIRAGSIVLVAIVSIFLLYANNLFIKRRSKEIGLFQLIGMTKNKIFQILSIENFILYFGALFIGIFFGFSVSKLILMIFFKLSQIKVAAKLQFSSHAFIQTLIVFCAIFILIMLMNYFFIRKQSILSLFRVVSSTEQKVKKMSFLQMIIGVLGIVLIACGYFISSKLFGGYFSTEKELLYVMVVILASVIIGSYFFYKGSVSFIFNMIRKKKDGYLNINEVLSLTSIMFRMKSSALLLTIITVVSALAIGLLSLCYISYYSAEKSAKNNVAADFSFTNTQDTKQFEAVLHQKEIPYKEKRIDVIQATADLGKIVGTKKKGLDFDPTDTTISVISDQSVPNMKVAANETIFTGYDDLMKKFMPLKDSGQIHLKGQHKNIPLKYLGLKDEFVISWYFTSGGFPVVIVDETVFKQLKNDRNPAIQKDSSVYIGITLKDETNIEKANKVFTKMMLNSEHINDSRLEISTMKKTSMGLVMFVVGFLGLTFLITSGCILYFKQMDESEEEKPNYTILRKLGFTHSDLLKGIRAKQIYNFGIPLVIGLLHSYFAVQSGWFLFGTEVWTPMIFVMVLYTALYSIFGILSVQYYKKVIKEAL